jgi:hypothetical protein
MRLARFQLLACPQICGANDDNDLEAIRDGRCRRNRRLPPFGAVERRQHSRYVVVNDSGSHRRPERQCLLRDTGRSERHYIGYGRIKNEHSPLNIRELDGDINQAQQQRRAGQRDTRPRQRDTFSASRTSDRELHSDSQIAALRRLAERRSAFP